MPRKKAEIVKRLETAVLPWERQTDDSEEAWETFVRYRDMPRPRAISKLHGARPQQISDWYRDYGWKARIEAYDRYLDGVRRDEIEAAMLQDARVTAVEHMGFLRDGRELIAREMAKYLKASQDSDMPGIIRPGELVKLMETVMKFDRLLNNQSTSNTEIIHTDMTKLSDEELAKLVEIQKKIHGDDK